MEGSAMVSRPDGPIPGGVGPDEGDIPSDDIPDVPDLPDERGDPIEPDEGDE
jgi:hypothetical protein